MENGKIANAERTIEAQKEIIKRNISEEETRKALKIIEGKRKEIVEADEKVTKYSDVITTVKDMQIEKQLDYVRKAKLEEVEKKGALAVKEISFNIVKTEAKKDTMKPKIETLERQLDEVKDPEVIAKFERQLKNVLFNKAVIERRIVTLKTSKLKTMVEVVKRLPAQKTTVLAADTLKQIREMIEKNAANRKGTQVLIDNLEKKVKECKTEGCTRSIEVQKKYETLRYKELEKYKEMYQYIQRETITLTRKTTVLEEMQVPEKFEEIAPKKITELYKDPKQMQVYEALDQKQAKAINDEIKNIKFKYMKATGSQLDKIKGFCKDTLAHLRQSMAMYDQRIKNHV